VDCSPGVGRVLVRHHHVADASYRFDRAEIPDFSPDVVPVEEGNLILCCCRPLRPRCWRKQRKWHARQEKCSVPRFPGQTFGVTTLTRGD
jgi:hypothetical protein